MMRDSSSTHLQLGATKNARKLRATSRQVVYEAERVILAAWADSKTRTAALQVWERSWERMIPFLAFPRRSAASSTPPTPSKACTCRSARRSKHEDTSPTTTPPCG
jgi:hypothetical protein